MGVSPDETAIAVIIAAAGSSSRMGGGVKKEYRPLGEGIDDADGRPLTVLGAAAGAFAANPHVGFIVITIPYGVEYGQAAARAALPPSLFMPGKRPPILFAPGGATRRASVHNALTMLSAYKPDYVLIHDGGRPWVDGLLIEKIIDAMLRHQAAAPLLPLTETPKEFDREGFITRHLRRASVGTAQTPQGFAFREILRAHALAAEREFRDSYEYTDDAEVWGEFIGPVAVVEGSPRNKKITFPEDLG
ncbi:MAG: 2-C-methyl-D-erythritol 4-phosphate cytidylyltransferase [Treponema sp.]|jgi:2-C-methyl-D-erythritol 4-phosphate cytidylyltransferase|nr:2-C-methyl-D-erythritol 4-phosphate cytidylyltransferase [Treponema sp.]